MSNEGIIACYRQSGSTPCFTSPSVISPSQDDRSLKSTFTQHFKIKISKHYYVTAITKYEQF